MSKRHATRTSPPTYCGHCFDEIADGSHAECPGTAFSGVACPWCGTDIAADGHAECGTDLR